MTHFKVEEARQLNQPRGMQTIAGGTGQEIGCLRVESAAARLASSARPTCCQVSFGRMNRLSLLISTIEEFCRARKAGKAAVRRSSNECRGQPQAVPGGRQAGG